MRSQTEINREIDALEALKPIGPFAVNTRQAIADVVEELRDGWDITTDEFDSLSEGRQELITMAREWKNGDAQVKPPSTGWEGLVKQS